MVRERQKRGIYRAWFTVEGFPVFYAVTETGEILPKWLVLKPGKDEERELARLQAYLDRLDPPRPRPELVKDDGTGTTRRQITPEQIAELYRRSDRLTDYLARRTRARGRGQLRSF